MITSVLLVLISSFVSAQDKPNIVYILVDNVGYGNFGTYGGTVDTPNIDKLAKSGIQFNNYNVEAQCTPTRSAIMTGRHPVRSGTTSVPLPGTGLGGMSPWEYTLPELLSDVGYATALFGKWHLGDQEGRLPNNQGFDEWWGIKNSWDEAGYTTWPLFKESGMETPMIWEGKKGQKSKAVMPLNLKIRPIVDRDYIIPKTVNYIKNNAKKKTPFFVYVGYSEAHPPIIINEDFSGKSTKRGGKWADMIAEMDFHVGEIIDAVKDTGIENNTIFIFCSDNANGGFVPQDGPGSNGPFRGDFANVPFEGSMRVPAIISWPGKVPAGIVTQEIFAAVDWLPTIAGMIGEQKHIPTDRPIDGIDASAMMLGKSNITGRDNYMFFGTDGGLLSVKWKVYKTIFRYTEGPVSAEKSYIKPSFPMIYDLSSDPHEDNNLMTSDLTVGWIFAPNVKIIGAYEHSLKEFPNIKVGQDFKGY
ncbi:arylsulfatase [Formosa agariphila KMM 3901]|uniref:Arylsulfatase n=1 Tax=Formosa agariphila (strain DSM 15362 / KCTC 12365 / LMG 23005 / KMM 3901 / M-2Alg 35-1) TaxID=1347342 RepID=T2KJ19_FORAG|nr:arylsulfatase [Formosa agariphila KMM 3901]